MVLVPALTGLVIAVLAVRFFPRVRGSGVNQTKGALYIYDGYISSKTVVGKFVLSALAIGSGQSLGPEDPSLQIGAGIGFGPGALAEALKGAAALGRAGRCGGRPCGCLQRSNHGSAVRDRGGHWALERRNPWRGGAVGDLKRGGGALVHGR